MVCNTQSECSVDETGFYHMGNDRIFISPRKGKRIVKFRDRFNRPFNQRQPFLIFIKLFYKMIYIYNEQLLPLSFVQFWVKIPGVWGCLYE